MLSRYTIPSEKGEGWAVIVIDTETGFFATVSDWGNYSYLWTHPGMGFKKFLMQLTPDYLHPKLLHGRGRTDVIDGQKTVATIRSAIVQRDRTSLDKTKKNWRWYNTEIQAIENRTPMEEEDFEAWCSETRLEEPWQYKQTRPEPQAMSFCTLVWPRFVALLKAEEVKEAFDAEDTDTV
jgi:hypothetical protein